MSKFNLKTNKAFTLIELLLVISIIGLLSTIVGTQITESRERAEDAHMKTEVKQVENALALHKNKTGAVPQNYNCSGSFCSGGGGDSPAVEGTPAYESSMQELVNSGVMPSIPRSPKGDRYVYYADEENNLTYFMATLQNSASATTQNSCGFSGYIDNPFLGCGWGYDPNDPNIITTDLNVICPVYGTPSGPMECGEFDFMCNPNGYYPNGNSSLGTDVCHYGMLALTATVYCELNNYGQNSCSSNYDESYGATALECSTVYDNDYCNGSNNLHYCSCI